MAQFDALAERYNEGQEWQNFRAGQICAAIGNAHRDPKKTKAFKAQDFMPGKTRGNQLPTTLDQIRAMNIAAGGDDIAQEVPAKDPTQEELKAIVEEIKRKA